MLCLMPTHSCSQFDYNYQTRTDVTLVAAVPMQDNTNNVQLNALKRNVKLHEVPYGKAITFHRNRQKTPTAGTKRASTIQLFAQVIYRRLKEPLAGISRASSGVSAALVTSISHSQPDN